MPAQSFPSRNAWKSNAFLVLVLLMMSAPVEATTRKVYVGGTAGGGDDTYTNTQLQDALNDAACGDTILLQTNITYTGEFIMRDHGDCTANPMILQTGVDASGNLMNASEWPAEGVRPTPANWATYAAKMAHLVQGTNQRPALRTVDPGETGSGCASAPCVARGWTVKFIEAKSNAYAGAALIYVGNNSTGRPNDGDQDASNEIPDTFVFDRIIVSGDPVKGQHRGMLICGKNVTVKNSYVHDIKGVGYDAQGVNIQNTPGPLTFTNNYFEASGQAIMPGGDIPRVRTLTTVCAESETCGGSSSPAPTVSSARLTSVADLATNQWIVVQSSSVLYSVKVATISGNDVTWAPNLPDVPDTPGAARWSTVAGNVTMTKNYMTKNPAWRQAIVPAPTGATAAAGGSGATRTAGTYGYKVVARVAILEGMYAVSTFEQEATVTLSVDGPVRVTWTAVANAYDYRIYGRTVGAEDQYWTVTAPTTQWDDPGTAGTAGTPPTTPGDTWSGAAATRWTVKTSLELKECDNCTVEGNIIEYSWSGAGATYGYPFWFKIENHGDPSCPPAVPQHYSAVTRDIIFRYNKIRHAAGVFSISYEDAQSCQSGMMENVDMHDNLAYDIGNHWGTASRTIKTALGNSAGALMHGGKTVTINHNTFDQISGTQMLYMEQGKVGIPYNYWPTENFVYKNNLARRLGASGVNGLSGCNGEGLTTWNNCTTGTSVFTKNVVADATATYPDQANNYFPTSATLQSWWTTWTSDGWATNNYRLKAGSPWSGAGDDNKDVGADIDAIEALTNIAESGNDIIPPDPPSVTTTSLPRGTVNVAYSQALAGTAGVTPYVWSVVSGQLPNGLQLSAAGVISGTPTTAGTSTFTVRLTDSYGTPRTDDQELSITNIALESRPKRVDRLIERGVFAGVTAPSTSTGYSVKQGDLWFDEDSNLWKYASDITGETITWSLLSGISRLICANTASVLSTTSTAEQVLVSCAVPANTLSADGQSLRITVDYESTQALTGTNYVRVRIGTTTLTGTPLNLRATTMSTGIWHHADLSIKRFTNTTQQFIRRLVWQSTTFDSNPPTGADGVGGSIAGTLTLSSPFFIELTFDADNGTSPTEGAVTVRQFLVEVVK